MRGDVAFGYFAHNEFVIEEAIASQTFGLGTESGRYQVWILVAEREDATGLDADEWCLVRYKVFKVPYVIGRIACREMQASFRYGRTAALPMAGNLYSVAQRSEQPREGKSQFCFLQVGKLVGEEVY